MKTVYVDFNDLGWPGPDQIIASTGKDDNLADFGPGRKVRVVDPDPTAPDAEGTVVGRSAAGLLIIHIDRLFAR